MLRKYVFRLFLSCIMALSLWIPTDSVTVHGEELSLASTSAILIEASTGQVLYEKNPDEKLRPASVTKVMTLLLAFEQIDSGKMKMDDTITISDHAASMGGSQCFFEMGETQTVEDIIKCIVIASGNDAAVAMAEHIAGSEEAFVELMNQRAKELGMNNTHFENACGLEAEGHVTTARDISIMSRELTTKHPKIFDYSGIWMDNITHVTKKGSKEFGLANTNKFLKQYQGATGLKTGYTSIAKYAMSATATRNDVNLIAVIMGAETKEIRNSEAGKLLDYGFANCNLYSNTVNPNEIGAIPVKGGKSTTVAGLQDGEFKTILLKDMDQNTIHYEITTNEVKAPVKKNDVIGSITYYYDQQKLGESKILAADNVEKMKFPDAFLLVWTHFIMNEQ